MRESCRILAAALLGLLCSACSVTRHIPEGQYFLQKVKIEDDRSTPRKERITASDMEKYVRQTPNKRFLGTNFYVWLYEQADPAKDNRWNNWKRKIGQAPVTLDMGLTQKSAENLKVYMDSKGFFSSQATYEVDTVSRRKRATVTFRTRQGEPYRIDSVSYEFQDNFLEQIVLPDTVNTLLHTGDIYDVSVLDAERERIAAYLKERGYYNFSVNNISYAARMFEKERLIDLRLIVKQYLTGYDERGLPVMDNNMVYRIDRINIFPDYDPTVARTDTTLLSRLDTVYYRGLNIIYEKRPNLRPPVLRQAVPLYPNYVYNSSQVNRAYSDLMALGYFKSAKIAFEEQPRSADVTNIVSFIGASADSTQTLYTREGYLTCNILCTPTLKQSVKVDLEGSTTSSFYGLKATVGYQNRNIFRRVVRPLLHGGLRIYEGSRRQAQTGHRIRRHDRTDLPAVPRALAHGPFPHGEPAEDQGRTVDQFSGPPLLRPYAFERRHHLHVDQQPLFVLLAAADRHQRGRHDSPGRSRIPGQYLQQIPDQQFQDPVHRRPFVRLRL